VVVFTFATVVLSGLLYSFNTAIRDFYEGYPWQYTAVGQWRMRHYKSQLEAARTLMSRTLLLRNELKRRDPNEFGNLIEKIENERTTVGWRINNAFPNESYLVLPTRLGNIMRSFETYPFRQYKMAGVPLWPRLRAKIDKEYAAAIDDAKTPLDFIINISFLSAVMSTAILVVGLLYPIPLAERQAGIWWGLEILAFAFLSYLSYLLALNQTREWGNMFKSSFDLYRWDLLKQLGYKQLPTSITEERALWGGIYRQMMYGDPPGSPLSEYASRSTFSHGYLDGEPFMVGLQTTRGVDRPDADGVSTVTLRVKNKDGQGRLMKNVVIRDTLPDGFDYIWDSASIADQSVTVSGSNPYYFQINDLDHNSETTLIYKTIRPKK
jgi:hypothetical protein